MRKQYALARLGEKRVDLWVKGHYRSGTLVFYVINGAWNGSLKADNSVVIEGELSEIKAEVVWEGEAPFSVSQYNEAIAWINQQLGWS